nr:class II aldolase/adducin family protein [uncultured Lichenicoccus sp.]
MHRKRRFAATFRLFARYGFDQGLAGHVSARIPDCLAQFWINPLARHSARSGSPTCNSWTMRVAS